MTNLTTKPVISLRERALGYLSRREYSCKELAQKLSAYAEPEDDVPALIEDFKQRGWLSEERYAEQIVHARKSKFGSMRVAHELREHGVAEELVEQALAEVRQDELGNARAVWQKKFKTAPKNREEWAKQARFLQGRGFSFELIKKVLNDTPDETI
ncbi:MAG TPA: recombination regulator RecX [Methylophilaceae bacterium]|nr:recombination regulator RecX [Methylophilaceae bacterium]